jgi:hypothetical protein
MPIRLLPNWNFEKSITRRQRCSRSETTMNPCPSYTMSPFSTHFRTEHPRYTNTETSFEQYPDRHGFNMALVAPGQACHQKRVVEFGEYLCEEILKAVPHRHFILSIPKILRRYFLYDRSLLSDLSRCGWPQAHRPTARRAIFLGSIPISTF